MTRPIRVASAALLAGVLAVAAPVTSAQAGPEDEAAVTSLTARLAAGTLLESELTPDQVRLLGRTLAVGSVTQVVTDAPLSIDDPRAASAARSLLATGASRSAITCKTTRIENTATSTIGLKIYSYYHLGAWCGTSTKMTKSSWAGGGGQALSWGWEYLGRIDKGAGLVAGKAVSFTQTSFKFSVGALPVTTVQPCLRMIRTSSLVSSVSSRCGVG